MKIKSVFVLIFVIAVLLCGCGDEEFTLGDTVWKYGNDVTIYFYSGGTGMINVAGIEIEFDYEYSDSLLTVTCTETDFAEDYGLDSLPFFGTNAVAEKDGSLFVGSWELMKTE